jgi:pilus assembly protein TadC
MYFGNRQVTPFSSSVFSASAINSFSLPKDSTKAYKSLEDFRKSLKDENGKPLKLKERKKLLKQQIKAIKKDKTISDGGKIGLIILCALLALVLAYGVAALSCSLSCSGSEGAAVFVAILGLAGIALLTFFLIRGIVRKSRKEKEKELNDKRSPTSN